MVKKNINVIKIRNLIMIINLLLFDNILIPNIISKIFYALFLLLSLFIVLSEPINLSTGYRLCLLCYCVFAIFSTLLSEFFSTSTLLSVFQFVLWTLFIALFNKDDIEYVLKNYLNILSVIICIAVVYSFTLKKFGAMTYLDGGYVNYIFNIRIKQFAMGMKGDLGYAAFYSNTNIFAFLLLITATWNLCKTKFRLTIKNIVFYFLMILGLVLADSRAGFFCMVLNVIMVIYFKGRKELKIFYLIAALLVVIVCGFIISSGTIKNFELDLTGRESMWNSMMEVFKTHKVFGIGFANSTKYVLENVGSHNSYLNILVENGIVGLSIFLIMIFCVLKSIFENQKKIRESKLLLFSTIIFIMYLPYAFFENAFMIFETRNSIWLLISLLMVEENKKFICNDRKLCEV